MFKDSTDNFIVAVRPDPGFAALAAVRGATPMTRPLLKRTGVIVRVFPAQQ